MSVIEVVKEVSNLTSEEKRRIWRELNEMINDEPIELRLQRALVTDGLLNEVRSPLVRQETHEENPPIKVTGKPVSETIIEERR
ncbi:MAG: hypothetical protein WKF34_14120 [Pyrinomonadaceae bacterium]